ncbi:MAG TPA: ATP-dependent DNA helicase [Candidatus Paceibacterota bacterium]|nr:ATP-dependent DNA helicase [Candidatus Paceibacterota bacterium]
MPTTPAFRAAYRALNPRQKAAVDTLDGPVMVVAGPGTGKTQVLTLRIANILVETDTPPEAVLALTFTEKAAFTMRERLAGLIGPTAYRVRIATFHAFANEIIHSEPDRFPRLIGGANITEPDQLGLIERIMEREDIQVLRPTGRPEAYVKAVLGAIGDLKGKAMGCSAFEMMAKKNEAELRARDDVYDANGTIRASWHDAVRDAQKHAELVRIWKAYERELTRSNRYDFADMLMEVVRALENDAGFRAKLQEKYLSILVDEHQDTNRAQNRIVQLIADPEKPNVFVVGDVQQAIFRFQGASPENFRDFTHRYPRTTVIQLASSYRSSQSILDAAAAISPAQGHLTAVSRRTRKPVTTYACSSPDMQAWSVARMIRRYIDRGTEPGNIAVLYRTNAEAFAVAEALERNGVPFAVRSDDDVLEDRTIRKLLTVARAAARMPDPGPLVEALHMDLLGLSPLDAHKIAALRNANAWDVIRTPSSVDALRLEDPERVTAVYAMFRDLARIMQNASAPYALQEAMRQTGFLAYAMKLPDGDRVLAKAHALFDLVRAHMVTDKRLTFPMFLDALDRLETHRSDLKVELWGAPDAVQLMTVHRAKGLEFDVVFIINAVQGHWDGATRGVRIRLPAPLQEATDALADEDDARRLFYVALTRARTDAIVTWPRRAEDGRELLPSAFVLTIPDRLRTEGTVPLLEKEYLKQRDTRLLPAARVAPMKQRSYLRALFDERGMTVTALNNYLSCPWRYFFLNLVRIPEAPSVMGEYGSATHAALKQYFDRVASGDSGGVAMLLAAFRRAIRRAPLAERDIARITSEGETALAGWYRAWKGTWHTNVRTEVDISDGVIIEGIRLRGKLDKVEFLEGMPSGTATIAVVDYKTKEPTSRNAIQGNTKSSTGDEWRQLVFYRLLMDHWRDGQWRMVRGEIDFLKPNASGRYKKEAFEITSSDVRALTEQVCAVAGHIRAMDFWNERCGDRECRYCRLRDLME